MPNMQGYPAHRDKLWRKQLVLLNVNLHADTSGSVSYSQKLAQGSSPPSVAILNGVGYHTEVYCSLLWSFKRAGTLPEAFVLKEATSGIQAVISDWYATHGHPCEAFSFLNSVRWQLFMCIPRLAVLANDIS